MMVVQDVRGQELEAAASFSVSRGFPFNLADVYKPSFSAEDQKLVDSLSHAIVGPGLADGRDFGVKFSPKFVEAFSRRIVSKVHDCKALDYLPTIEELDGIKSDLTLLIAGFFPLVSNPKAIASAAVDNAIGLGTLTGLVSDPSLEEIMINGLRKPVFIVHRSFGMCKTNISFDSMDELVSLVSRIARSVGKSFDAEHPLLDAHLSDGSRINATFSSITPDGPTLTIRKFFKSPLSIVGLIANKTLSSEAAAFLWLMVEGLGLEPMNVIVTGGASSGKTTTLNALSSFTRLSDRIISIEDTLELDLANRENWVRLESGGQFDEETEVSMNDLLKNALRMRPDRLIVGEVRGEEAQTMFVAMDTGHRGLLGTLHSNTAREMLLRLQQPPMNVSEALLPLLHLIVVQIRLFLPGKGLVRRVSQIAELSPLEGKPLQATLFQWQRSDDQLKRTETPSHVFEVLSERTSLSKNDLKRELLVRQRILEWMARKNITDLNTVTELFQRYYQNPQAIVEQLQRDQDSLSF